MDERICKIGDELRAEAQARSHELYSRLEATSAEMSARCRSALGSAGEAKMRQQQEMLALGNEVTNLKAAATSLTTGIVKALQVIGLLEVTTPGGRLIGAKG